MSLRLLAATAAAALLAVSGAAALLADRPHSRTISLHNIHTDETLTIEYMRGGKHVPEAMEKINWVMRDWRRNEATRMDPTLIDLLWEMHTELGSRQPINIISAYRSRATNNMLRKSVGGQASESRHILGKAADVQFPDVTVRHVRYAALVRERGGVGYYPTSATPFVHVDTDRVRAWPRLPRFELALLFPSGRTRHQPAQGGPIGPDDVRTAQAKHKEVALQIASYFDMRRKPRSDIIVVADKGGAAQAATRDAAKVAAAVDSKPARTAPADAPRFAVAALVPAVPAAQPTAVPAAALAAAPQAPKLIVEPRLADRPSRLTPRPSDDDRRRLTQLVALSAIPQIVPALVQGPTPAVRPRTGTAPAPAPHDTPAGGSGAAGLPPAAELVRARLTFVAGLGAESLAGWSNGWAPAPAWDEDHPEEVAYRPFPLAPFLTTTASIDDPALAQLTHPDLARTGELFGGAGSEPQMRLRPGRQNAQLMWSEEGAGDVTVYGSLGSRQGASPQPLGERRVRTTETAR